MQHPNVPRSKRNRTPEQEALMLMVRQFHGYQIAREALESRYASMRKWEIITEEKYEEAKATAGKEARKLEKQSLKALLKHFPITSFPIWTEWLKNVRGAGETITIQLAAYIQPITDFPTVSSLWAFAGFAVNADGQAMRRKKGETYNHNPRLKSLSYLAADCLVKAARHKSAIYPPYYRLYSEYKQRQRELHPEPVKAKAFSKRGEVWHHYTDGHINNMALRYLAKRFLSNWWEADYQLTTGEVPGKPYVHEIMGHTHIQGPWEMVGDGTFKLPEEKKEPKKRAKRKKGEVA